METRFCKSSCRFIFEFVVQNDIHEPLKGLGIRANTEVGMTLGLGVSVCYVLRPERVNWTLVVDLFAGFLNVSPHVHLCGGWRGFVSGVSGMEWLCFGGGM